MPEEKWDELIVTMRKMWDDVEFCAPYPITQFPAEVLDRIVLPDDKDAPNA